MKGDRWPGWGSKFRPIPCCGMHEGHGRTRRERSKWQRREAKKEVEKEFSYTGKKD